MGGYSWSGDWFLRRKRLYFINNEITKTIPHILFFQEMLAKKGDSYDSDFSILERSSLAYYEPFLAEYKTHTETEEIELAGTYLRLETGTEDVSLEKSLMWDLGETGYLIYQKIVLHGKPLYLFNINMPKEEENWRKSFVFIKKQMKRSLRTEKSCYNNIIVAGYFNEPPRSDGLKDLMRSFNLKDTSESVCKQRENLCFTKNPSNPILNSSSLINEFKKSEKILVHKSTQLYNAKLVYNQNYPSLPDFKSKYKLHSLAPSLRYGWQAEIKLAPCKIKNNLFKN